MSVDDDVERGSSSLSIYYDTKAFSFCMDLGWKQKAEQLHLVLGEIETRLWNCHLGEYGSFRVPVGEQKNMDAMYSRELNGVADIMRYEILFNEAGIAVDTD